MIDQLHLLFIAIALNIGMTKKQTIQARVEVNEGADQEPVATILSRAEALKFLAVSEVTLEALIDQKRLLEGAEGFHIDDLRKL